ncbi:MAG: ATP-binding cassette domain-containing protein, partial [Acidimicrobiales bacterium]
MRTRTSAGPLPIASGDASDRGARNGNIGPAVVELAGVSRTYAGDPPVHALRALDLTIRAGEWVAIVGPSGSGKSTLLNVVGLLDRQTSGSYRLEGADVAALDDDA